MVNVGSRLTHVLTTPENGTYQTFARVGFDEVLSSPALPGVALTIGTLPGLLSQPTPAAPP